VTETLHETRLVVNGVAHTVRVPARRLLADCLRRDLGLTGTHLGCEHGVCGACTVLVDGAPMRSCLMFAVSADGAEITTTEGCRALDGGLGPVQRAFHEQHGMQCGFCTPGFVMTCTAMIERAQRPDQDVVADELSGHLCRCTGYRNIRVAAEQALDERFGTREAQ